MSSTYVAVVVALEDAITSAIADYVLDHGLTVIDTEADEIHLLAATPVDYSDVTTNTLGKKTFSVGGAFGAPSNGSPSGRKVSSTAITDGNVTSSGTVAAWAVVDSVNSRLLAHGAFSSSKAVVAGDLFSIASFDITIPVNASHTIGSRVLDNGLTVLDTEADKLYICSALPTTYNEATVSLALGSKSPGAGNVFGSPAASASPLGRKVTSASITGGSVTSSGTATHWAVVDSANSRLLVAGPLSASHAVFNGSNFSLPAITFTLSN